MNAQGLVASASINIGMAIIILSLFSILKKQRSNALIYYARRLSLPQPHEIVFHRGFTLLRFLPSISWIPRAFRVTEDHILLTAGLDALVSVRLFNINFFVVCSIIGLVVLVPVNYAGQGEPSIRPYSSMDSFTISNVREGSNRLWVHFACLWVISLYGLFLLYKMVSHGMLTLQSSTAARLIDRLLCPYPLLEYSDILAKRIQHLQKLRHRPDQLTILVRGIPLCKEHKARGCYVDHFFSKHHPHTYQSYQMLYDGKEIEDLLNQAKDTARRIKELKERSTIKERNRDSLLLSDAPREVVKQVTVLEEKLQQINDKLQLLKGNNVLKHKELPVAFVIFKSRLGAALAAQSQHHPNPLLWITEWAPEPRDVSWRNLAIPFRIVPLHKIAVFLVAALLTIFFAIPVTAVQGIAKFEKLKKWFPPAMAVQLIPGLSSIVTGYLPSAILKGFIFTVPYAMYGLAKLGGCISKSKEEIKACNMVFYFLVGNVFFLSMLSGSLIDEIGESFAHPKSFPSHLAAAVTSQADFFMTYILVDGLSGFSFEVLQPSLLIWDFIKSHTCGRGKKKDPYLFSLPYFRIIPFVSLSVLIGVVYAVIAPLLLPFLIGYFCLGYIVYINQIEDVYGTNYETYGEFWPYIHHYIIVAIILMQVTMIGLFGLKSKAAASFATIPLLLFTIAFNEYCKLRFLPSFHHLSLQNAMDNDEVEKKSGEVDTNCENAATAYCAPCLRPVEGSESLL